MSECCCHDHDLDYRYQRLDEVIKYKMWLLIPVLTGSAHLGLSDVKSECEGLGVRSEVWSGCLFVLSQQGKCHSVSQVPLACEGAAALVEALEENLGIKVGDTTDDGMFTLSITRCLGACGLAPVLTNDEDVYGRLTPEKVPEILELYKNKR